MWSLLQKNGPRRRLLEIRLSPCHEAVRDGLAVHDLNEDIPELSPHAKSAACYDIRHPIVASHTKRRHRNDSGGGDRSWFQAPRPTHASFGQLVHPAHLAARS